MRRLIQLALLAAALSACDSFEGSKSAPSPAAPVTAPGPKRDSQETQRLSRAVADAALAIAGTCVVLVPYYESSFDDCTFAAADQAKLSAAVDALAAHAKARPDEVSGATGPFLAAGAAFAEWTALAVAMNRRRGTLALFQDFADAYNACGPAEPIPVDPVTEMYRSPIRGFNRGTLSTSKRVKWRPCFDGICFMGSE